MARSKIDIWNMALLAIGESQLIQEETEQTAAAEILTVVYDTLLRDVFEAHTWHWARRELLPTKINTQTVTADGDAVKTDFEFGLAFAETSQVSVEVDDVAQTAGTDYNVTPTTAGELAKIVFTSAPASGTDNIEITVTTSRVGWAFVYTMPSDFVSMIGLVANDQRYNTQPVVARLQHAIFPNDAKDGLLLACNVDDDEMDKLQYIALITNPSVWPAKFAQAVAFRLAEPLARGVRKSEKLAMSMLNRYVGALAEAIAWSNQQSNDGVSVPPTTPTLGARGSYYVDDDPNELTRFNSR